MLVKMSSDSKRTTDKISVEEMCSRLDHTIRKDLDMSLADFSEVLGYKNQSPLTRISNGKGLPSIKRLGMIGTLKTKDGGRPNINWILTGEGRSTISDQSLDSKARKVITLLGEEKLRELLYILQSP